MATQTVPSAIERRSNATNPVHYRRAWEPLKERLQFFGVFQPGRAEHAFAINIWHAIVGKDLSLHAKELSAQREHPNACSTPLSAIGLADKNRRRTLCISQPA